MVMTLPRSSAIEKTIENSNLDIVDTSKAIDVYRRNAPHARRIKPTEWIEQLTEMMGGYEINVVTIKGDNVEISTPRMKQLSSNKDLLGSKMFQYKNGSLTQAVLQNVKAKTIYITW